MNTVDSDERERQYFDLLDRIKLQKALIFHMQEQGHFDVMCIEDYDDQDIAAAR